MRVARWIAFVTIVVGLVVAAAPAASGSSRGAEPDRADLVTHVFAETGHRVVAVALRYDEPLLLRRGSTAARTAFAVDAMIDDTTTPRTVLDVYSSPTLPGDEWRLDARPGRYLIVELDPGDANAGVNGNSADGATAPRDLDGAYTVTQTAVLRDDRGRTLTPPPYALENDGVVQPVVDAFERRSYTDAAGTRLAFRLFRPRRPPPSARARPARRRRDRLAAGHAGQRDADHREPQRARVGDAGASGRPARALVVAPQLPGRTSQWTEPAIQAAVMALVDRLADAYPIDRRSRLPDRALARRARRGRVPLDRPDRVRGRAARRRARRGRRRVRGARPSRRCRSGSRTRPTTPWCPTRAASTSPTRWPRRAPASPAVSGRATTRPGPRRTRPRRRPHRRLLAQARATRSHTLFTTYTAGTVAVNAHFSWGPMYETAVMLDWLFAQDRARRHAVRLTLARGGGGGMLDRAMETIALWNLSTRSPSRCSSTT